MALPALLLLAAMGCATVGEQTLPTAILAEDLPEEYRAATGENSRYLSEEPDLRDPASLWSRDDHSRDDLPSREALGPNAPKTVLSGQVTLAECLKVALASNESLAIGAEDYLQALLEEDNIMARTRPDVSANFRYAIENEQDGSGGGEGEEGGGGSFNERDSYTFDITAEIPIWHGNLNFSALRGRQALSRSQAKSLIDTRNQLALTVTEQYYTALQAARTVEVLRSQVTLNRERLDTITKLVDAGDARLGEKLTTQADVAQSQAALERGLEQQRLANERLGFTVGARIDGELSLPPATKRKDLDADALIARAQSNRPDLLALQELSTARREALETKRRERLPDIDGSASVYPYRDGGDEEKDWEIAVTASVPLYRSGRWLAEVRTLQSQLRQAQLAVSEQRRRIDLDLREAMAEYESSTALLRALTDQATAAEEAHRQVRREFEAGAASNLEVTTAQTALLTARLDHDTEQLRNDYLYRRLQALTGDFIAADM